MLHGANDRRSTQEASLPDGPKLPISLRDLRNGESILGRRLRLPLSERESIDMELGFVSILGGRDLRLRIGGRLFRAIDEWEGRPASTFIFDVIRNDPDHVRAFSEYGSALLEVTRAASITQHLAKSHERTVTIDDIPVEVRGLVNQHLLGTAHFERVEE